MGRLYTRGESCKRALSAYEKAVSEHAEADMEKWRSVLEMLLEPTDQQLSA